MENEATSLVTEVSTFPVQHSTLLSQHSSSVFKASFIPLPLFNIISTIQPIFLIVFYICKIGFPRKGSWACSAHCFVPTEGERRCPHSNTFPGPSPGVFSFQMVAISSFASHTVSIVTTYLCL